MGATAWPGARTRVPIAHVTPPRRILIVRLSHLGDVVHALPLVHALRAGFPDAELGWAVQREFADLVRPLPGLVRTFLFERRGGLGAWRALRREFAGWRPDWALDAQANLKSAAVARLSGAPRRTGRARVDWRERAGSWLINDPAPPAAGPHALEHVTALVRHALPDWKAPLRCDAAVSEAELADARRALETRGAREVDVVVQLSAGDDVRAWPAQRWSELAQELERDGQRALFLSGPAEAAFGAQFAARHPAHARRAHWIGQRGLRELAAAFTALGRDGAVFVGCDSGPMHLAWASGLRVVCLAGPQDARRTGPWPLAGQDGPHRVVRAAAGPECAPCFARRCTHPRGPVCMAEIGAADVRAVLTRARLSSRPAACSSAP